MVFEDGLVVGEVCYECRQFANVIEIELMTKREYKAGSQYVLVAGDERRALRAERVRDLLGVPGFKIVTFRGDVATT